MEHWGISEVTHDARYTGAVRGPHSLVQRQAMDQEFDSLEALWATAKIPPEASGCMSYEAFLPLIRVHASTQGYKLMDSEARVMFLASLPRTGANSSVSDAGRGGGSCIGSSGRVALEDVKRTLETSPWRLAAARAAEFSALELAATAAGTFVRRPGAACASCGSEHRHGPASARCARGGKRHWK